MDLLTSLQAFKALQDAKTSKDERIKLAKDLGYSKDPLEMTLIEFIKEFSNGTMKDKESNAEKNLQAARMLQNLPGVGVLNMKAQFKSEFSPLAQAAISQYLGTKPTAEFDSNAYGYYDKPTGNINLTPTYSNYDTSLLHLLNTIAHEQEHSDDATIMRAAEFWQQIRDQSPTYTDEEKKILTGPKDTSSWDDVEYPDKWRHHMKFRDYDLEAPLYNEAKLAIQRGESIPEWFYRWQPSLLDTLKEFQNREKIPITEDQLFNQLFLTNQGAQ